MKISVLSQVAKRNEDIIGCSVLFPAHSFCIVSTIQPCGEKHSKTQSSIHLQESQKTEVLSCKRFTHDIRI